MPDEKGLKAASSLQIAIVDLAESQRLNFQFRKKNKPTDILSFEPTEPHSLGELVICWPVIQNQAKEHELSVELELVYMLIHGILHLLGYEHEKSDKMALAMYRLQDDIFARLTSLNPTKSVKTTAKKVKFQTKKKTATSEKKSGNRNRIKRRKKSDSRY